MTYVMIRSYKLENGDDSMLFVQHGGPNACIINGKEGIDDPSNTTPVYESDDSQDVIWEYLHQKGLIIPEEEDEEPEAEDRYEFVDTKSIQDSDGFYTDYTMYHDIVEDRWVFVFGDRDLYRPEDEDFDWECESEEEAWDWFNDYQGLGDLDEDFDLGSPVEYSSGSLTREQCLDVLIQETDSFTREGTVETTEEEEKNIARDILKNHYRTVEVSDGRRSSDEPMSWVISYSDPIGSGQDVEEVATEIVQDLHSKFPQLDFYNEQEVSSGIILYFDGVNKLSEDESNELQKYFQNYSCKAKFRNNNLTVLVKR